MDLPPAPTPPVNNSSDAPSKAQCTSNLLNLLKFSGGSGALTNASSQHHHQAQPQEQTKQPQQQRHKLQHDQLDDHQRVDRNQNQPHSGYDHTQYPVTQIHQPAPIGADPSGLLAALMKGAPEPDELRQPPSQSTTSQQSVKTFGAVPPSSDTRAYLLNLLNRPKPNQTDPLHLVESVRSNDPTPQSPEAAGDAKNCYYGQYQQLPDNYISDQIHHTHIQQHTHSGSFSDTQPQTSNARTFSFPLTQESSVQIDKSPSYQQLFGNRHHHSSPQSHNTQEPTGLSLDCTPTKGQPSSTASSRRELPYPGSEHSSFTSPSDHRRHAVDQLSLHSHRHMQKASNNTPPKSNSDSHSPIQASLVRVGEDMTDQKGKDDLNSRNALHGSRERGTQKPGTSNDLCAEHRSTFHSDQQQIDEPEFASRTTDLQSTDDAPKKAQGHDTPEVAPGRLDEDEPGLAMADKAQTIVDSWDSVDQEEVITEGKEVARVRVFNLPMKPWISLTLQDSLDPRPLFRDESIMDIARLRREFDQLDRNLYTASPSYMTYGMSKQGGLRVIRQDDGKDAKVFTDTKDRIFSVAMLVSPPGSQDIHREAIIGTGISGTVYWVQIKEGEKDHIDDAHLEQYGFALPPMINQEASVADGALKTRVRASKMHPEYFAVGRGKTIHFVWPSYVMKNNLFKIGHDRVVDTDRLLKQCSLRINNGKSGKDFVFSQDDTVIVSLDKSGHIKFWDVRELTAVNPNSDPRVPMPAQTSLEIKEPLLTLSSMSEEEKTHPTSVMFVDKQRPFQKRCALRYLIVGLKQNHTLQLWDLALGKPVQEFNLPHSNNSDAVCSLMYHPASGIIVIGHPTRNSIYFTHLSAPKYNLKGISQVEYIQRLVAQDLSIPQPGSTAVISGVREYSFANRGVIRSLDILSNPAMVQDTDEPTLFELYAMHSKGVACILIRQSELGWSKENKVLDPVDAVQEGLVTVSKLEPGLAPGSINSEDRLRNGVLQMSASNDEPHLPSKSATPVKPRAEVKDMNIPTMSWKESQTDKQERRSGRKKGMSGKEPELGSNGTASFLRATPLDENDEPIKALSASVSANGVLSDMLELAISGMEGRLTSALSDTFNSALRSLRNKIDEEGRVRDKDFTEHQLKLLDMVSETLNENTQKVLESLIHHQFTELVIPAIGDHAGKALKNHLQYNLQPNIATLVQKEIQNTIPRSLRSPDFLDAVSSRIGSAVASSLQQNLLVLLKESMANVASQSAHRIAHEIQKKHQDQYEFIRAQQAADANKVEQLLTSMGQLTDMMSTMAVSQSALQSELIKLRKQSVRELPVVSGRQSGGGTHYGIDRQGYGSGGMVGGNMTSRQGSFSTNQVSLGAGQPYTTTPQYLRASQPALGSHGTVGPSEYTSVGGLSGAFANTTNKNEADNEYDLTRRIQTIEQMMQEGRLQEAAMQWFQSGYEQEIFRRCLCNYPPNTFESLPPLLLLVVLATISRNLAANPYLKQKIDWMEVAVKAFNDSLPSYVSSNPLRTILDFGRLIISQDWKGSDWQKVMESASRTMELLVLRLKPLIASSRDNYSADPFLSKIDRGKMEWIVQSSEHILRSFASMHHFTNRHPWHWDLHR